MGTYGDALDIAAGAGTDNAPLEGAIPDYLKIANMHQEGATGQSIFDPSTWGERADHFMKFSIAALTRGVATTTNTALDVGTLWQAPDSMHVDTSNWLHNMDDDLGNYYDINKDSINTVGDLGSSFIPGLAGVKILNVAQRALGAAREGKAGLSLASTLGTLPTKQALFAEKAAAEISESTSVYSYINANLAKSIAAGYAQNALEVAAFNTAAAVTMHKDSPLFSDEDVTDIAYNSLLGGGIVGAGIMGSATVARTLMDINKATKAVDVATHAYGTVEQEVQKSTPSAHAIVLHAQNRAAMETLSEANNPGDSLYTIKARKATEVIATEKDAMRQSVHDTVTGNDAGLGNHLADALNLMDPDDLAAKLGGVTGVGRLSTPLEAEKLVAKATLDTTAFATKVAAAEDKVSRQLVGTTAYDDAVDSLQKARDRFGDAVDAKQAAQDAPVGITYLKLYGEDMLKATGRAATTRIADTVKTPEAVLDKVASYGHKQGQDWSVLGVTDPHEAEARYIAAQHATFDPTQRIGTQDIPFLERAFQEMVSQGSEAIPAITLKDGTKLDKTALWYHLEDTKGKGALALQAARDSSIGGLEGVALTDGDIAKAVNVPQSLLRGERNLAPTAAKDLFAMQTQAQDYTAQQVAAGNYSANKPIIKTWLQPAYAKMAYDISASQQVNDMEIKGVAALKQEQAVLRSRNLNASDSVLGAAAPNFMPRIPSAVMQTASRTGTGQGMVTAASDAYTGLGSVMQYTGGLVEDAMTKKAGVRADIFNAHNVALLGNTDASTELWKTTQLLRQTPEKYTPVLDGMDRIVALKNIKQADYDTAIAEGADPAKLAKPVFEDAGAPVEIPLQTEQMQNWATSWHSYQQQHLQNQGVLHAAEGQESRTDLQRTFYVPPTDVRKFPHFAFVVDDSITGTGHISTIHANTAGDLNALAAKVPTEQGLKVLFKGTDERWHKAMQDYDYELGINDNYVDSALKRSGVSGDYFPRTDPELLLKELMDWRKNQDNGLIRHAVEVRYEPEFAELKRQGDLYDQAQQSRVGYTGAAGARTTSNPFSDYRNMGLNLPKEDNSPWSALNRLAENTVAKVTSRLSATFDAVKSPEDLEAINKELESIGCKGYSDAATYALANHSAPAPALSNFIRKANSLLTLTMLKSDPMNALNNGFGHMVLYAPEMVQLRKDLMGTASGQAWLKNMQLQVPGTPSAILSPAKLAANAYSDFFKNVIRKEDGGAMLAKMQSYGTMKDMTRVTDMMNSLTLDGSETSAALSGKIGDALKSASDFLGKASGNNLAEQMNRFVATHTADAISGAAIKAGVLDPALQGTVVNTFVNRTQGVINAAQRPLLFRGPVGQAVGLFQSYQFNMLQNLFRHIGNGDTRQTALLLGMQGSIYGLNGMPAFNAMNQYLVGNAAGNTHHADVYSKTYDTVGQEAGDWLLYGASSNFLLNPNAKINLYSRGDINPRQVTVIPTTLADVPIVGATSKFFSSMYETAQKVDKGGSLWNSFLQGVEHSGISRPLAGIAQAMEASTNPNGQVFSTNNAGNIVMQNDLFSATTAARIAGAKPLDEARALDAYYRNTTYEKASAARLENVGEAVKASLAGGTTPTPDQVHTFLSEYTKSGGNQLHFNQWMSKQVLGANKSTVNSMAEKTSTPTGNYMQKINGGYELQDFINDQRMQQQQAQQQAQANNGGQGE